MIEITQSDMELIKDGVTISNHRSAAEAIERASQEGPGTYTLRRPDGIIIVREPKPTPE